MKCLTYLGMILTASLGLASFVAAENTELPTNIVASLTLDDGRVVQFQEPLPGVILFFGQGSLRHEETFADLSLDQLSAVELYERLSDGSPAPKALLEAQERVELTQTQDALFPQPPPGAEPELDEYGSFAADEGFISQVSESEFQRRYCQTSSRFNFKYCYLRYTCNHNLCGVQETASFIEQYVNPYRGNVLLGFDWWHDGRWENLVRYTVLQDQVQGWWAGCDGCGPWTFRASLSDAEGDGFHWAVYGY